MLLICALATGAICEEADRSFQVHIMGSISEADLYSTSETRAMLAILLLLECCAEEIFDTDDITDILLKGDTIVFYDGGEYALIHLVFDFGSTRYVIAYSSALNGVISVHTTKKEGKLEDFVSANHSDYYFNSSSAINSALNALSEFLES